MSRLTALFATSVFATSVVLIAAGCSNTPTKTAGPDAAVPDMTAAETSSCTGGMTYDQVMVQVQFIPVVVNEQHDGGGLPDGGSARTSLGFNIDNYVAAPGDPKTCGHASFSSPDGTPGIDNQLGTLIPVVDLVSNGALEPDIQNSINNGQLLIGVSLANVDDLMNDPCVTIQIRHLSGTPTLGTDMILNPNQTFNTDADVPVSTVQGAIKNGVVSIAMPFDLAFPVNVLNAAFTVAVHNTHLTITLNPDGTASGLIGGAVATADLVTNLEKYALGQSLLMELPGLLASAADQDLDPTTGMCAQISVAMSFNAKPAFINP